MKLTHDTVLKRTWKNRCFPFLIMGLIVPLCIWALCAFHFVGLIIAAAIFALFFCLFFWGYMEYSKVKRKEYVVYRQACTSEYNVKNTVDGDQVITRYSVFGDVGEYKHKGTDTHMPDIHQGETYYLIVLQGETKISAIFSAKKYALDTGAYSSADQYLYTPL